jgi:hypothetical protein
MKKISFAGKEFIINSKGEVIETDQVDIVKLRDEAKVEPSKVVSIVDLKKSFKYYHEVLRKINSKAKSVSSVGKSKLDWKEYKTK